MPEISNHRAISNQDGHYLSKKEKENLTKIISKKTNRAVIKVWPLIQNERKIRKKSFQKQKAKFENRTVTVPHIPAAYFQTQACR